jgi:hypothetical protein
MIKRMPGSAGSGGGRGKGLRQTAAHGGVGTTPAVMALKRDVLPARMDAPTSQELWRSIKTQQCCFCADTRTFSAISQHWTRGHGIDLQDIRDQLGVPKNYGFASIDLAHSMAVRGRERYNPAKLKPKGGPRFLSEYGRKTQREKFTSIDPEFRKEIRRRANRTNAERGKALTKQYALDHPCVICGSIFIRVTYHATTCSKECNELRRTRNALRGPVPERQSERICKNCGVTYKGRGQNLTCSMTCQKENMGNNAKNRTGHLALLLQRGAEARANRPTRYCSIQDCNGIYRAKDLCGKHYQQKPLRQT